MEDRNSAILEPASPGPAERKQRDLIELTLGYIMILGVIWAPRPLQRYLYCATAVLLIAVLWISFPGWKEMGLRTTNLVRSVWIASAALLVAAIAILFAARLHTLLLPGGIGPFFHRYLGYALWAMFQQVLLQDYFLLRLLRLVRSPVFAALAAALIFSVAHLPNPLLTVITLVWGVMACLLFLHYRNLYPLALAHAILGITIAMTVPGPVTHNMRVGLGYLTYSSHRTDHRSH